MTLISYQYFRNRDFILINFRGFRDVICNFCENTYCLSIISNLKIAFIQCSHTIEVTSNMRDMYQKLHMRVKNLIYFENQTSTKYICDACQLPNRIQIQWYIRGFQSQ